MSAIDLARAEIRALTPYSSARMEAGGGNVLLNANESPWPAESAAAQGLNRYPDPQPRALTARLAKLYDVAEQQVLVGRGSDEAIDLLVRGFCRAEHDAIAISPPTFGMYAVSAAVQGAAVVEVPLRADFSLDVDALLDRIDARVKLVFVCTPNNPSGGLVPLADVQRIVQALHDRALVIVDEAYIEFAGTPSATTLLDRHDNLVVLRTLSKAHALAGARVGSLIAHSDIVALLRRILSAYPLPSPSVAAALSVLTSDVLATTRARVATIIAARDQLAASLRDAAGVREVFASAANFLLLRFDDAEATYRRLIVAGILVRDVSRHASLKNCLRISVGSDSDNARLLDVLAHREVAA